jgi:hypothetical protein
MYLENITIIKQSEYEGECSIKLTDEDGMTLILNKLIIDLTNGAEPVKIVKFNQTPVVTGSFIEGIKTHILELWQDYFKTSLAVGAYVVDGEGITKL